MYVVIYLLPIFLVPQTAVCQSLFNTATFPETGNISTYLINGRPVEQDKLPYVVRLGIIKENLALFLCSGSIVSTNYVLTAAHCVTFFGISLRKIEIKYGNGGHSKIVSSSNIKVHPKYRHPVCDIALLKTDQEIQLSGNVKLANLLNYPRAPNAFDRQSIVVAGWGATETEWYSESLNVARLTLTDHAKCREVLRSGGYLPNTILCTRFVNAGPCWGDGGGPVVVTDKYGLAVQIAVVGSASINCQTLIIYTYLGAFTKWIQEEIK